MRLVSLTIEGFRNIEHAEINFDQQITTLVSLNNYGKSNLLQAIQFSFGFISASKEEKKAMMSWRLAVPLNKKLENKNFFVEYTIEPCDGHNDLLVYSYEFEWIKNDGGCRIVDERLSLKENAPNKKPKTYVKRYPEAVYLSTNTARCNRAILVGDDELIVNLLLMEKDLFYHSYIELINSLKTFKASRLQIDKCFEQRVYKSQKYELNDLLDFGNIPIILNELKRSYEDRYNKVIDLYVKLFPDIQEISIEQIDIRKSHDLYQDTVAPYFVNDHVYSIYVKSKNMNQPLNAKYLSDGSKKVLLMMIFAAIADIKGLSLLEIVEPENCVHPRMYSRFLEYLGELSGDCKILISTHSPYMLKTLDPKSVYIGIPNVSCLAKFSAVRPTKELNLIQDAKSNSVNVGDYIFKIMAEMESNQSDVLLSYLNKNGL